MRRKAIAPSQAAIRRKSMFGGKSANGMDAHASSAPALSCFARLESAMIDASRCVAREELSRAARHDRTSRPLVASRPINLERRARFGSFMQAGP
jgi:hypothetical protein